MIDIHKTKKRAAAISVVSNTCLVIFKLVVGVMIGSVAVISEAIHSAMDLVAAVIALFAVKASAKPADEDHAYGHEKVENIAGTIEALLIFLAAIWIIYEAASRIYSLGSGERGGVSLPLIGVAVMGVSALVNWRVSANLFRVGRQTDSIALQADAWHLRTDVWTSLGVMGGLLLMFVGGVVIGWLSLSEETKALWQARLHWIDPIAAIVVAVFIMKAAWDLTVKSTRDLTDRNLPRDEVAWIRSLLERHAPAVHGFHKIRTRKAGARRFVDFHIWVEPNMTVETSHRLAHHLAGDIEKHFGLCSVTVHVEPCHGNCEFGKH